MCPAAIPGPVSRYFFRIYSASIVWGPTLYWAVNCVALSLERTLSVPAVIAPLALMVRFDMVVCGTLREPPYRSLWISCAAARYNGPTSYLIPPDHTTGFLDPVMAFSSGSPTEYNTSA